MEYDCRPIERGISLSGGFPRDRERRPRRIDPQGGGCCGTGLGVVRSRRRRGRGRRGAGPVLILDDAFDGALPELELPGELPQRWLLGGGMAGAYLSLLVEGWDPAF